MKRQLIAAAAFCSLIVATSASAQWIACTGGSTTCTSASVGIGTTTPVTPLEIPGSTTNSSAKFGTYEIQSFAVNNAWLTDNLYYNSGFKFRSNGYGTLSYFLNGTFQIRTTNAAGTAGTAATPIQRFIVFTDGGVALGGHQITGSASGASVYIDPSGRMGIGTTTPAARLDVAGSVNVTGNIAAKYQDFAEWVPAATQMDPGTVVVLDRERANEVTSSRTPYDTSVAGVISSNPGILLGEPSPSKVLVSTSGRVRVKVDATREPIRIGDLLVTSDKPGLAMKSNPIAVSGMKIHRPGTLIGKALEPLDKGQGEILVLLSLQ